MEKEELLSGILAQYWPIDVEIAGHQTTELIIKTHVEGKDLNVLKGAGVSEFPITEFVTVLAGLCAVISTTLQVISMLKESKASKDKIRAEVRKELKAELHILIESKNYEDFLSDYNVNKEDDE